MIPRYSRHARKVTRAKRRVNYARHYADATQALALALATTSLLVTIQLLAFCVVLAYAFFVAI